MKISLFTSTIECFLHSTQLIYENCLKTSANVLERKTNFTSLVCGFETEGLSYSRARDPVGYASRECGTSQATSLGMLVCLIERQGSRIPHDTGCSSAEQGISSCDPLQTRCLASPAYSNHPI